MLFPIQNDDRQMLKQIWWVGLVFRGARDVFHALRQTEASALEGGPTQEAYIAVNLALSGDLFQASLTRSAG